jgi:DNA polymerase I-like protein with 3'-5' exonuclease and polymerase domains
MTIHAVNGAMLFDAPMQYRKLDPNLVKSDWRPPHPDTWPRFSEAKRVGFDTEFRDAELLQLGVGVRRDPKTHYIIGYSIAVEHGPKVYLPVRHDGGDNLDDEQVVNYLKHEFARFEGDLVGANVPCDLDWMWERGIAMPKVHRFYDIQIADPLLYELERSYRLGDIAKRRGLGGKNEDGLRAAATAYGVDAKDEMWRLPARHVGPYAEDDGVLPLKILRKQEHEMAEQGLLNVWDMESRLLPILLRMQRRGVVVDLDRVEQMRAWAHRHEQAAWDVVHRETGIRIPVGESMNVSLLTAALRKAGLEHAIGENTRGDSVTKDVLNEIDHPVAKAIMEARKMAKLVSTYVNSIGKYAIQHGDEWRIHCTFNQIRKTEDSGLDDKEGANKGVAYGRLSSSNPNMQNQPAADRLTGDNHMGCMWRSVYKPDRGLIWTACDVKQQEPKWSFHYGEMLEKMTDQYGDRLYPGINGAVALCDRLRADPLLDTYEPLVELTGKKRSVCKVMWLARAYGKGNGNMCEDLGYPTEDWVFVPRKMKSVPVASDDGQRAILMPGHVIFKGPSPEGMKVIDDFDASMPFLKSSAKLAEATAKERGYIKLLSGRRCHFEDDGKGGYDFCNKAFNRLIQGTSAEQTKAFMIAVDDAGYGPHLLLQVHDELDAALETEKQAHDMAEIMKTAMPLSIPTVIDIEQGPSWGESMSIEEVVDGEKVKYKYKWDLDTCA